MSKPYVASFIRANPPTAGHMKLLDKAKEVADQHKTKATVFVSHSQDHKKNPLTAEQKIKHLKRFSSDVNYGSASKEEPTILHKLSHAHAAGHDELHMIAGEDRVDQFHDLIHKYNGVEGPHGHYNFKKIHIHSSGDRDPDSEGVEGVSATKQREHASNGDMESFKKGLPSHIKAEHAEEMYHEVKKGMEPPPKAPKKKTVKEQLEEKLKVSSGAGEWIKDFQQSDDPRFSGDSKEQRRKRAIAAYLSAKRKNESVEELAEAREYAGYVKDLHRRFFGDSDSSVNSSSMRNYDRAMKNLKQKFPEKSSKEHHEELIKHFKESYYPEPSYPHPASDPYGVISQDGSSEMKERLVRWHRLHNIGESVRKVHHTKSTEIGGQLGTKKMPSNTTISPKVHVESMNEAKVETQKYSWGTMKTVRQGSDFSIPLHPEHHQAIDKLNDNGSHNFTDETGEKWKATRKGNKVHFTGNGSGNKNYKTAVDHRSLKEEVELDEEVLDVATTYKRIAVKHLKDMSAKGATQKQKDYAKKMHQRALEASKMDNHTDALDHYRGIKEEVNCNEENMNEERRENILKDLLMKEALHNAIQDKIEKLSNHMMMHPGEIAERLKASLVREKRKHQQKIQVESEILSSCELFLEGELGVDSLIGILDEASVGDVHSAIHKGLVKDVHAASENYTTTRQKHGEDHQATREAALGVHHAVNKVVEHLRSSGFKPNKKVVGGN